MSYQKVTAISELFFGYIQSEKEINYELNLSTYDEEKSKAKKQKIIICNLKIVEEIDQNQLLVSFDTLKENLAVVSNRIIVKKPLEKKYDGDNMISLCWTGFFQNIRKR